MGWWQDPLGDLVGGRRVIVAGGPATVWTAMVARLRELGATEVLVVATDGAGVGAQPDAPTVVVEQDHRDGFMAAVRASLRAIAEPPPHVVDAVEAFDADRTAVVFGTFLSEASTLVGRPLVAHRRPEWVALEDKTRVDALLDRAGIPRAESGVVPIGEAAGRWHPFDRGHGTVWAADARDGYHGGASLTRWVTDDDEAAAVTADLAPHCDTVRVMPFLDGVATSIHGIVLPDGVVALRPVELVTLRGGHELRYSGCATFWDPPAPIRAHMRDVARRLGELLRAEVDFRGAFTLDGVATADGFRPTELNPRFGAGLGVITRGLDIPLHLVLDLVVAGHPLAITAADLEAEILASADGHRVGGSWQVGASPLGAAVDHRPACFDGTDWRWATDGDQADGQVVGGPGFTRIDFDPARTPVGPSVGERSAAFWRFADAELGTAVGPLTAPGDATRQRAPSAGRGS